MAALLSELVGILQEIAPLSLAASWDNVGLLIDPGAAVTVRRVLFTIDLSEEVVAEARGQGTQLIVAYHPPIFQGLKRLSVSSPKDRVIWNAVAAGLAVYSPHTALDAVPGGVNDWLARGLGQGEHAPIEPSSPSLWPSLRPRVGSGMGRTVRLTDPITIQEAVARTKSHLGLKQLRVAIAPRHAQGQLVQTGAVCAGAGGSVLCKVTDADLLITGEMRHHDVVDALGRGQSVILSEHTHTERGFLPEFAAQFRAQAQSSVETVVSQVDADPLSIA